MYPLCLSVPCKCLQVVIGQQHSIPPQDVRIRFGSRRDSRWANSALVVSVDEGDWAHLDGHTGVLPSTALQVETERCGLCSTSSHAQRRTYITGPAVAV